MSYQQPYQDPQNARPTAYQPAAYPPPMLVTVGAPTSGWATASLVFGIIGLLGGFCFFAIPCIVAVVCGHIGLAATKDGSRGGRGQAVAGLILGYVVVGPAIAFMFMGGLTMITGHWNDYPSVTPSP